MFKWQVWSMEESLKCWQSKSLKFQFVQDWSLGLITLKSNRTLNIKPKHEQTQTLGPIYNPAQLPFWYQYQVKWSTPAKTASTVHLPHSQPETPIPGGIPHPPHLPSSPTCLTHSPFHLTHLSHTTINAIPTTFSFQTILNLCFHP